MVEDEQLMATPDKCERGHYYLGTDYCPTCRIADLEYAIRDIVDAHTAGGRGLLLLKIRAAQKLVA